MQKADVTVQKLDGAKAGFPAVLELLYSQIFFVTADDQVIDEFIERASGLAAEMNVIFKRESPIALRDVVRNRPSCTYNLIAHPKLLVARKLPSKIRQIDSKRTAHLPSLQILERLKGAFTFPPLTWLSNDCGPSSW